MESSKRILLSSIGIAVLIVTLVGVTYAFFNYTRTGSANVIKVGRIYFNTSQNGNINLINVFPISSEELENDTDNHDSIEITITGDTTYNDGVEYLVTLVEVNNTVNNKEIPVSFSITGDDIGESSNTYYESRGRDSSIYQLTEEGEVRDGKYLLVGYIAPGQTGINGSITLTAFVNADKIAISDTYSNLEPNYAPDPNMSSEALNYCINFFTNMWGQEEEGQTVNTGETYEAFCRGTGTNWGSTFTTALNQNWFDSSDVYGLIDNKVLVDTNPYVGDTTDEWVNGRTVLTTNEWNSLQGNNALSFKIKVEANEGIWVDKEALPSSCFAKHLTTFYKLNDNMNQTELNYCNQYMTSIHGKNLLNNNMNQTELNYCVNYFIDDNWEFDNNGTAEDFCNGIGTSYGASFQEELDNHYFSQEAIDFFENHNIIVGDYTNYCRNKKIIDGSDLQSRINESHPNYNVNYLLEHNIINEERGLILTDYNEECGTDIIIPNKINYAGQLLNTNISQEELNTCVDYFRNTLEWTFNTNAGETIESFCNGTGTFWGTTLQQLVDEEFDSERLTFLKNNNIIIDEQPTDYNVIAIDYNFYIGDISSLVFNKSLRRINHNAFAVGRDETIPNEILIPASVQMIGQEAFMFFHNPSDRNYYEGKSFVIEGKPYIYFFALPAYETIIYNGTCQELLNYHIDYSAIIFDDYANDSVTWNVITTDTSTCPVSGGYA